ncbi:hypothetical protein [Paenibacillus tarimensis]|uniref:hypothetical protein n=1 Tax=Paenibacillus tarimensis TaxID=416012 RepID=UPI001F198FD5|nr:hypothetical protein [Paenibacillus tarimensis]MCF2942949.1 hypothetical protein [Paenibacillus tarimensis]
MADGFKQEDRRTYRDVSTVESQRNDLTAEEFPEGPYGATLLTESLGKSRPWRIDQRPINRFDYENRSLHKGLDRDFPGDQGMGNAAPEVMDEP